VVEVVSGMSYNKYIEEEIFHPLDISSEEFSFNYDSSPTATGYISKYSFLNSIFYLLSKSSYYGDSSNGYSSFQKLYNASYSIGGSLANTKGWRKILSDLLKDNSILLSDKTKLALFTQQKDSIGNPIETSLGLHTGSNQGEIYYGKPGGGAGFFSNIRIYPHIGIATVILSNTTKVSSVDIYKISDQVDKSFLKTRK
jgi:CubicO group peptidase (beta-lactamase class C family)